MSLANLCVSLTSSAKFHGLVNHWSLFQGVGA